MKSLLLLSILVVLIAVPLWLAKEPRPRRALRKLAYTLTIFTFVYLVALRFVYPRLL